MEDSPVMGSERCHRFHLVKGLRFALTQNLKGSGVPVKPASLSQGCLVATAAYGSYLDPHVLVLRKFRDEHLVKSAIARDFVSFYYRHSPPFAAFIVSHPMQRAAVRWLDPAGSDCD